MSESKKISSILNFKKMSKQELIQALQVFERVQDANTRNPYKREDELRHLVEELQTYREELQGQNGELKKVRDALEESRDRYARLFDFAPVGYINFDRNGCIKEINLTAAGMLGYERQHFVGKPFIPYIAKGDSQKFLNHLARCKKESGKVATELGIKTNKGEVIQIELITVGSAGSESFTEYFQTAVMDINEKKRAEAGLRRAHEELEHRVEERTHELAQSNKELEQFAYVASHDLQEPLRLIVNYAELLSITCKETLNENANEYVEFIQSEAFRAKELISELLEYAKVGSQRRLESVDLEALLTSVLSNLKLSIQEAGAEIVHDPLPTVIGDRIQLTQLFQNLIANSLKYKQANTKIRISVKQEGDEWVFLVKDNGIGIDLQFAERIFKIFQRLHTKAEYAGTGIGLAICKKIVESHKGRIWLNSKLGKGTTFYFTLPVTTAPKPLVAA
jgi:two-component system, chemotaxis family, sensor kinase Cph1